MKRQYPDRPIVGIGAVVWKADRFLLIRRGKPPREGLWSLPGGAQAIGETVSEAAIREVREETGLEVLILGLIDVVDSIDRDDSGGVRYHYTLVDLLAAWRSGEAVAGDDAVDAAWFHLEDLDSLDLWEETHRIIRLSKDMMDALG